MTIIYSLLSACFHPIRDIALKGKEPRYDVYLLAVVGWVFIAAIQILATGASWTMSNYVYLYAFISAIGNVMYYSGIGYALRRGDVSVYYPIFRTTPVFMALLEWMFWGKTYTFYFLAGMVLIIIGALIVHNGWRIIQRKALAGADKVSLLFALYALVGSIIYIMADAKAMQGTVKPEASTYLFYNLLFCSILFIFFGFIANKDKRTYITSLTNTYKTNWRRITLATGCDYASYYLILVAESMKNSNIVLINTLRLWDIPLSVILARVVLKEKNTLSRFLATAIILVGSILLIYNK